jgi:hypothetical protein
MVLPGWVAIQDIEIAQRPKAVVEGPDGLHAIPIPITDHWRITRLAEVSGDVRRTRGIGVAQEELGRGRAEDADRVLVRVEDFGDKAVRSARAGIRAWPDNACGSAQIISTRLPRDEDL